MIIVPTDGSERSRQAIPHAEAFAKAVRSPLGLLEIIDVEEIAAGSSSWPQRLKAAIEEREDALRSVAQAEGVAAEPLVRARFKGESIAEAILRSADERGGQMLVMNSRGHGSLRHAILGSVAMGVVSGSEIPVMVTGPAVELPRAVDGYRIFATSDGSEASEAIFTALSPFYSSVTLDLLTVYVPTLGDAGEKHELVACHERLTDLKRRIPALGSCEAIVLQANSLEVPEDLVIQTARNLGANALAMSTHGHSVRRHLLLGSFAAGCLGRSHVPVILARQ